MHKLEEPSSLTQTLGSFFCKLTRMSEITELFIKKYNENE